MTDELRTTVSDRDVLIGELPEDLNGRSVNVVVRYRNDDKMVDEAATIVNAAEGQVEYVLSPDEISRAGTYRYEWEISGGDLDPTTHPRTAPATFQVREALAGGGEVYEVIPPDREVGTLTADSVETARALFSDAGSDPDEVGELLRNGADVKVYSGGGVKNLTNIGTSSGGLTDEEVQDIVGGFIASGTNVTVNYDDTANTLTISATDTDTQLSTEQVQDIVGAQLTEGPNVTLTYDDVAGTLEIASTDTDTNTQLTTEEVQDIVGGQLVGGTNVTLTYDDAAGSLTIDAAGSGVDDFEELVDVSSGTLANRPAAGTTGNWYFTTDGGVFYDNGTSWLTVAELDTDTQLTDAEVATIINNDADHGSTAPHNYFSGVHDDLTSVGSADHHTRYADSEAVAAVNADADHGSTAPHNYFSGSHADLTNITSGDHHAKTTSQSELTDFSSDASTITVAATAPASPSTDDIWIDTS